MANSDNEEGHLHVFINSPVFIRSIKSFFNGVAPGIHYNIVVDKEENNLKISEVDYYNFTPTDRAGLIKRIKKSKRLHIHFMTKWIAEIILSIPKDDRPFIRWYIWGADLYENTSVRKRLYHQKTWDWLNKSLKFRLKPYIFPIMGKLNIPSENHINRLMKEVDALALFKSDLELARNSFNLHQPYVEHWGWFLRDMHLQLQHLQSDQKPYILVNHSSNPTGNHLDAIHWLSKIEIPTQKKILCPLTTYPDKYSIEVEREGQALLGRQFEIIEGFVPEPEFHSKMSQVSHTLFFHHRQQGFATLIPLIYNGVKVALSNQNSLLKYFRELGLCIGCIEEDVNKDWLSTQLSAKEVEQNRTILNTYFVPQKMDDYTKRYLFE